MQLTQFTTDNRPWGDNGTSVVGITDMNEARTRAGLDWEIEKVPLKSEDGEAWANTFGIRRADTHRQFGVCGNVWHAYQNKQATDWIQPLLDAGLCKLDTIGSISGGQKIFILCETCYKPVEIVPGDAVGNYLIIFVCHDGKTSIRNGFIPHRLSCTNQLPGLLRDTSLFNFRFRHSQNVHIQIDRSRDLIAGANEKFLDFAKQLQFLAKRQYTEKKLHEYIKQVLKIEKKDDDISTRNTNIMDRIKGLVSTGLGNKQPRVRGTWYAAFNGMNQYLNYNIGRSVDTRMNSLWFGQGNLTNERALERALVLAA